MDKKKSKKDSQELETKEIINLHENLKFVSKVVLFQETL